MCLPNSQQTTNKRSRHYDVYRSTEKLIVNPVPRLVLVPVRTNLVEQQSCKKYLYLPRCTVVKDYRDKKRMWRQKQRKNTEAIFYWKTCSLHSKVACTRFLNEACACTSSTCTWYWPQLLYLPYSPSRVNKILQNADSWGVNTSCRELSSAIAIVRHSLFVPSRNDRCDCTCSIQTEQCLCTQTCTSATHMLRASTWVYKYCTCHGWLP
jgi:hypothetical protein